MIMTKDVRVVALCLFAVTLLTPFGCKSAGGEGAGQSGAGISEPLTMLPEYQARAPRKCAQVTKPPSAAQATVLVQCTMDATSSRPFVYWTDAGLAGIDLKADVYPLRGSYTGYFCQLISNMAPAGQSCIKSVVPEAQGWCWKTSFGDWKCKLQGGAPKMENAAAPTTF